MSLEINILLALLISGIVSLGLLPLVLKLAARRQLYDTIDGRKIHHGNIPRLGGVVFVPVLAIAILSLLAINMLSGSLALSQSFSRDAVPLLVTALACVIIFVAGVADDIFTLRYRVKFVIQFFVAGLLCLGELWVNNLWGIFGLWGIPLWAGVAITIILTVFVINAFNFIDGIDGLCASLSLIAMLSYGLCFLLNNDVPGIILCASTIGMLLPYLYFNLFGREQKGTKLFMGDAGSTTLGLLLVAVAFRLMRDCEAGESPFSANPALLALAPLLLPCFDVVRVFFVRLKTNMSPFLPDRNHIHHRLLDCGYSQHRCLIVLLIISVVWSAANIILSIWVNVNLILLGDLAFWLIYTGTLRRRKSDCSAAN